MDNRQNLHNLVDKLNDWEVQFILEYIKKIFQKQEDD